MDNGNRTFTRVAPAAEPRLMLLYVQRKRLDVVLCGPWPQVRAFLLQRAADLNDDYGEPYEGLTVGVFTDCGTVECTSSGEGYYVVGCPAPGAYTFDGKGGYIFTPEG